MSKVDPAIDAAVAQVGLLLHRQIGLRLEPALQGRLRRCIREQASEHGQDLPDYLDALTGGGGGLQSLIDSVTVQETSFFRHPEHFDLLARDILPGLHQPVTLWSAACSNGQEAFSLAMLLDEQNIDGSVIASDLSTSALQRTAAARYSPREMTGLSPERIARHLTAVGGAWQINKTVRDRVHTLRYNLLDAVPVEVRAGQVIFCRNVLFYLSADYARAFLDRVANALPTAALFLGAAETIWQLSDRFDTIRTADTFSYFPRASRHLAIPTRVDRANGRAKKTKFPSPAVDSARPRTRPTQSDSALAADLGRVGQQASAAGDCTSAVVAFRKCAYLTPHDPMAHLHLGLALDTAGDGPSAQRAYSAARLALLQGDPTRIEHASGGYTAADLVRLLDSKQQREPDQQGAKP